LGARQRIDAALVDVHLPGMSGIEVCRILLENAATAGRYVVGGRRSAIGMNDAAPRLVT
jgi:CheY-like chemotaxis protein